MIRVGGWLQTYSGKQFWPLSACEDDIDIVDIAHALSLKCRFNGHCKFFYSVAEHSVRMSREDLPGPPKHRLLHDAAEAYLPDIPRPIKQNIINFKEIEDSLLSVIFRKFGLCYDPGSEEHNLIKYSDDVMLATEQRDIMSKPPVPWGKLQKPLEDKILPWDWYKAKAAFLHEAERLRIRFT